MAVRKSKSSSEIFVWSALYRLGISVIDRQHKKLVDLVNVLARRLAEQADGATLLKVIDALASYAEYHFRTEDRLMRDYAIDATSVALHQKLHNRFIDQVAAAREAAREKPVEVSARMLTFLSRWLIQHILGTDRQMAGQIIAVQKGLTPAEIRKQEAARKADTQEILLRAMGELYECLAARTQQLMKANRQLQHQVSLCEKANEESRQEDAVAAGEPTTAASPSSRLTTLNEAAELMLTCTDRSECYRVLAQTAVRLQLGAGGVLAMRPGAEEMFAVVARWGTAPETANAFAGKECWAIRRGRPNEVTAGDDVLGCGHMTGKSPAGYLCIPLMARATVAGLLVVQFGADADPARRDEAMRTGVALGNLLLLALTGLDR